VNGPAHQRLDIVISFGSPLQVCEIEPQPEILAQLTITYDRFTITAKRDVMYTLPVDAAEAGTSHIDVPGLLCATEESWERTHCVTTDHSLWQMYRRR
jgi:hypothetical protein